MHHSLSYFTDKTVLVTGAAGFIGSHLCDRLLALGARVVGVDNFMTGRRENLAHIESEDFTFIEADVITQADSYLPEKLRFDAVLHFASPASPPRYQAEPVATYLVNTVGTHNLLQYLRSTNPQARFVFASTSEIYGDPLEHPQKESYWGNVNPNGERSCYDESKRMGETICGVHERDFKMDIRIVRIFNTYGPRMDPLDGRVIPNLINQALNQEAYTIFGDGSQTRSYCFIDDEVEGILRLAAFEGLKGETINIGNADEYTVLQTVAEVHQVVRPEAGEPKLEYQKLPADDPTRRRPDISKAKKILEWEPQTSFQDGLKPTITYFSSLLKAA